MGISPETVKFLSNSVAASCEYDQATPPCKDEEVDHWLENVAIALQLIKPTAGFLEYKLRVDSERGVTSASIPLAYADIAQLGPPLAYQQHHALSAEDVRRAIRLLPILSKAMELGHIAWTHPFGATNRALVLFCQGYTGIPDLAQLLWAAGLDCLFASKVDQRKRGSAIIADRLRMFWGTDFRPYEQVTVPIHQSRPTHRLADIAQDIFRLRNAYIHGLSIPESWLSPTPVDHERGYAYQLLECTEIVLRVTLTKILGDPHLLDVFLDPKKLDRYF
jgi:hypothetical protein